MKSASSFAIGSLATRSFAPWLGFLALAILTSGCSKPTTGTLTGMVKLDGQPVDNGSIAFFPVDGKGRTAGGVIKDGKYSANASLGQMKVEIRAPKIVGEKKAYDVAGSPIVQVLGELVPARYNDKSELTVEVTPGEIVKDFELTSK